MKFVAAAILALFFIPGYAFADVRGSVVEELGYEYEEVAAGQTAQVLGAVGAAGDKLRRLLCDVATAATSAVSIKDGSDTAIALMENNVGSGVGPYQFDLGIESRTGAWQITTGAGVSCLAVGTFTD